MHSRWTIGTLPGTSGRTGSSIATPFYLSLCRLQEPWWPDRDERGWMSIWDHHYHFSLSIFIINFLSVFLRTHDLFRFWTDEIWDMQHCHFCRQCCNPPPCATTTWFPQASMIAILLLRCPDNFNLLLFLPHNFWLSIGRPRGLVLATHACTIGLNGMSWTI